MEKFPEGDPGPSSAVLRSSSGRLPRIQDSSLFLGCNIIDLVRLCLLPPAPPRVVIMASCCVYHSRDSFEAITKGETQIDNPSSQMRHGDDGFFDLLLVGKLLQETG